MLVTSLYLNANLPRVDLTLAGNGRAPPPRNDNDLSVLRSSSGWWQRDQATLDMGASRPYMALSFAKRLGFINDSLNAQSEGTVTELSFRPGGWHPLSVYEHRTRYWGLGTLPVSVNLAGPGEDDRIVDVVFMVFDDSCLPAHSSVEVVLHSAFVLQLQGWTTEASAADGVSLSFSQNLSPEQHFTVSAIPGDERSSSAAPPPFPSAMSDAPADPGPVGNDHCNDPTRRCAEEVVPTNQLPCMFDPNHPLHARTSPQDPPFGSAEQRAMTATVPELWLDGHNQEREPQPPGPPGAPWLWYFGFAGVILWFMDDNFDSYIVGADPPGEGPASWSGECQYNFIGSTWCEGNGILVDTKSPVPVRYLTDERYPNGIPGHPEVEVSVIGSTKLRVAVDHRAPRTLTFLVVSVNHDNVEVDPLILNYRDFDLDPELFWKTSPTQGPQFNVCEPAPFGAFEQDHLASVPRQDSIIVGAISTSLVPPPVKRVTRSQSVSTPSDPAPTKRRPSSQDPSTGKISRSGPGRFPPDLPMPPVASEKVLQQVPLRPSEPSSTLSDNTVPAPAPPAVALQESTEAGAPSRPASPEGPQPLFTGPGLPLSQTPWPSSSAPGTPPPPQDAPVPSQPDAGTSPPGAPAEGAATSAPAQGAATSADPPPPPR